MVQLPECRGSGGVEAAVASEERKAKVEGSCGDAAVVHTADLKQSNVFCLRGFAQVHIQ